MLLKVKRITLRDIERHGNKDAALPVGLELLGAEEKITLSWFRANLGGHLQMGSL